MTHARIARVVFFCTFLPGCGETQIPDGSTRSADVLGSPTRETLVVNVMGNSTKVVTLRLEDRGLGEPVLFLMAGGGAPIEFWGEWISMISALAPVVTYDRPGIGGSAFDGIDPTPQRVAEHAHELLNVLDVPPPYILVGWSWGGPLIRFYAGKYPEDIVGMVYLDPSDMTASPAENIGASNEGELRERQAELDAVMAAHEMPPGVQAEGRAATGFFRSPVADRGLPDDLDVPTSVVLATLPPSISADAPSYMDERYYEMMFARRVRQFGEWTLGRPNTTLIVTTDAGHAVFRDDPDLAIEAVRRVVERVSANRW